MGLFRGPALQSILDQANALGSPGWVAAYDSTLPTMIPNQLLGNVTELGGKFWWMKRTCMGVILIFSGFG